MNSADNTVKELAAGIIVYGILAQIICLVVTDNTLSVAVGLWIGIATALGMMIHMKRSIEDALDFGEEGAPKHMRKTYVIRSFCCCSRIWSDSLLSGRQYHCGADRRYESEKSRRISSRGRTEYL